MTTGLSDKQLLDAYFAAADNPFLPSRTRQSAGLRAVADLAVENYRLGLDSEEGQH